MESSDPSQRPQSRENVLKGRCLSLSAVSLSHKLYRPPRKGNKLKAVEAADEADDENNIEEDKVLDQLLDRTLLRRESGHQVLVIQPYIKWGVLKKRNTTPQLQLMEAVTLIKTLRHWRVVDQVIVPLQRFHGNKVLGSGTLDVLRDKIKKNHKISAVFISKNTLTLAQQSSLEAIFGVPVYDRYTIIMQIFKEHAHTREAKLQVQLAQLPYLRTVLPTFGSRASDKYGVHGSLLGGEGPSMLSLRKEVFRLRQAKIRREIESLREQRTLLRQHREKQEIPVVAVIGYTNAGKTSLIKALTGKEALEPQDYLFATLDVSSHLGELPSGLKAYFVDTLGFISDIPTYLIESFVSTLEDATLAHVIIHVRDISHPDTVSQNDNVLATLKGLNLSQEALQNIITVGNKMDLLDTQALHQYQDLILVSSTRLTGIDVLRHAVETKVLQVSGKAQMVIRVETGSPEYTWLHSHSTVLRETPDPNNTQFTLLNLIISPSTLAKFKHNFINNYRR